MNRKFAIVPAVLAAPLAAHAALPTEVTTMFTTLGTDVASAIGLGWVLFAVSVGGFFIFKIIKRALSKA